MSWRTVIVSGTAKLDYKMDYLVVRKQDSINRIHLSEIGMLIVESTSISLTTTLLCEMIKHKTKVIFCDEKHNPCSELVPYYGSHDTSAKLKSQIAWTEDCKLSVWTEIVAEKIRNQSKYLSFLGRLDESELLSGYISELEFGDESNREGHAAKVYFNALFGKSFTRSDDISINAALNYGYGILLSYFTREIVANGYITQLGIFHDNMFNHFNLASDLMEPFRVLVDIFVRTTMPQKFDKEDKLRIYELFNDTVLIDGQKQIVSNAIRIYTKSVLDALNDGDASRIKFFKYEL